MIQEGNVVPCAHRSTARLPHNACHPVPCPLKNERRAILKSIHLIEREIVLLKRVVLVTGARAAIHTFVLADLLDVETVAVCRAGLGAFTVLHSNGTLGDFASKQNK